MITAPLLLALLTPPTAQATEGYYKDLFMDSGHDLTQREELHAAEALGLSYDVMVTDDVDEQYETVVYSPRTPTAPCSTPTVPPATG